jgi:hypothetical protein
MIGRVNISTREFFVEPGHIEVKCCIIGDVVTIQTVPLFALEQLFNMEGFPNYLKPSYTIAFQPPPQWATEHYGTYILR